MAAPLEGLRVLDLTTGITGPHATKLLTDFGATVTKLEPPGGDRARYEGPFPGAEPNTEASVPFLLLNTNKRSWWPTSRVSMASSWHGDWRG